MERTKTPLMAHALKKHKNRDPNLGLNYSNISHFVSRLVFIYFYFIFFLSSEWGQLDTYPFLSHASSPKYAGPGRPIVFTSNLLEIGDSWA